VSVTHRTASLPRSRVLRLFLLGALPLLGLAGCDGGPSGPVVASVTVEGPLEPIPVGGTAQFTAQAREASGAVIPGLVATWSSTTPDVADVNPATGLVTARGTGSVTIRATVEGVSGSRTVQVIPPPVATIEVTPSTLTLRRGSEENLVVTLRDAQGAVLSGRGILFTSISGNTASVNQDGRVRGERAGVTAILVASEGRQVTVPVTVTPGDEPEITGLSLATLEDGATVLVSGRRLGPTPAENIVRFGGVLGTVLSAAPDQLEVRLPSYVCAPEGPMDVTVEVGGDVSSPFGAQFRPNDVLDLAVGAFAFIPGTGPRCVRLAAGSGSARYLVGVQSVSALATQVDAVTLSGRAGALVPVAASGTTAFDDLSGRASPFAAPSAAPRALPQASPFGLPTSVSLEPRDTQRWVAHRDAHAALRQVEPSVTPQDRSGARLLRLQAEMEGADPIEGALRVTGGDAVPSTAARAPAAVPASAQVGDTVRINVPDLRTNFCLTGIPITGRIRAVGTGSIWVEDVRNPPGGFTDANYQALATRFDERILAVNVAYFGAPTDLDGNGRVVVVISQEVNRITPALGFVVTTDFFPKAGIPSQSCPASNEGEYYYAKAPDPTASVPAPPGREPSAYSVADALADAPTLLAHETTHIIQLGRRLTSPTALELQTIWELEGQATFAEEVVGLADRNLSVGGNYGFNVGWNSSGAADVNWFRPWITDLALYFGFRSSTARNPLAPGACGWLDRDLPVGSLGGACATSDGGGNPRLIYGVPFSFLRWLSDHRGDRFPGGEQELHRRLVDAPIAGFPALAQVLGEPVEPLLARWAAALYTDDRLPPGSDPTLSFRTWNFRNIFEEGGLFPTVSLAPRTQGYSAFDLSQPLRPVSSMYTIIEAAGGAGSHPPYVLRAVNGTGGSLPAHIQMWVVRLQ
jgi:hypothetical protein